YLNAPDDGDGRVPLQCALLPGVKTWKVDATHGKLPGVASAFAGYIELLATGATRQLDVYEAAAHGARGARSAAAVEAPVAPIRSRPSRGLHGSRPPSDAADVLGASVESVGAGRGQAAALSVSVFNGD